jgi:hypothetical protein
MDELAMAYDLAALDYRGACLAECWSDDGDGESGPRPTMDGWCLRPGGHPGIHNPWDVMASLDPYSVAMGIEPSAETTALLQELRRVERAGLPETLGCFECGGFDGTAPERKVVRHGPVVDRADPTQTYVLECGHTVM